MALYHSFNTALTVPIIFNYHGRRARGDLLLVGNGLLIISKHSRDLL